MDYLLRVAFSGAKISAPAFENIEDFLALVWSSEKIAASFVPVTAAAVRGLGSTYSDFV